MQTPPEAPPGIQDILRVSRQVMLMEPIAEELNDLLMVPPVRRVMQVAEALAKMATNNETIRMLMQNHGVMAHLREEGRRRGNGDIVVPQAFVTDFDRVVAREGEHA